jgi:arginine exporter protein ArgO
VAQRSRVAQRQPGPAQRNGHRDASPCRHPVDPIIGTAEADLRPTPGSRRENQVPVAAATSKNAVRDRLPTASNAVLRSGGRRASTAHGRAVGSDADAAVSGALVAGLLAGYGIAVPIGAIAVLIVGLTARAGLRTGAAAALGVATADGLYAIVAVLGGSALGGLISPVARPLKWVAAVVLVVLAVRTTMSAVRHHRDGAAEAGRGGLSTPGRAYLGFLGLTLLNPMTIVYFGALVLGRRAGGDLGALGSAVFVAAAFVASASWQLLLAGGGSVVGRVLTGPRGRLGTALLSGVVVVALAVWLVVGS